MEKEFLLEWPPPDEPAVKKLKTDQKSQNNSTSTVAVPPPHGDELKLVRKDPSIETLSLLAQWWKWIQQQTGKCPHSLPHYTSPNTSIHYIIKLPLARRFLRSRISYLEEDIEKNRVPLAVCHYLLGNVKDAMRHMKHVSDCTTQEVKWQRCLIEKQYHTLMKQQELLIHLDENTPIILPEPTQVERRNASELTFKDFFLNYAMKHTPVIITGLKLASHEWSLEYIKKMIGHKTAPLRKPVTDSVEWARLESCGEMKVSEFIDNLKQDTSMYLFDWSIPLHCPELAEELIIPKYFSGDLLQHTPPGSLYQDSWPSLFIAPAGITSALHVDAFGSNFWMALFEGRKRWTFFPPEDLPCLYPQYHMHSTDPVFDVTLDNLQREHPLITKTHPRECILKPGEVLFVPAGSPHQVENLESSLAISANFVDPSNIELVCEELRINALVDPRAKDLVESLNRLRVVVNEQQKSLSWKEFKC